MKTTITQIIEEFKKDETKVLVVESAFDKGLLLNKLDEKTKEVYKGRIFTYEYLKQISCREKVLNITVDKEVLDKHAVELGRLIILNIGWYLKDVVEMDYSLPIHNLVTKNQLFGGAKSNVLATELKIELIEKDIIDKIYCNEDKGTTVVVFKDGTKEISRVADGEAFDLEVSVLQCLVKKLYGSRSAWLKELYSNNKIVETTKTKKSKKRTIEEFLESEFVIHCESQIEAIRLMNLLEQKEVQWISERCANSDNTNWSVYKQNSCYSFYHTSYGLKHNKGLQFCEAKYYREKGYEIVKMKDIVG